MTGGNNQLTDTACKNVKPREKAYRLSNEKGLYLQVMPNGCKYFRQKYQFSGKQNRLAFWVYPKTSLKEARDERDEAREQLVQDIDPGAVRKAQKAAELADAETFEGIAREWHAKFAPKLTADTAERKLVRLERWVFPWMGAVPIVEMMMRQADPIFRCVGFSQGDAHLLPRRTP